ncbi:MAG: (E)-4-hydroxy-3-methylbut-2-enyl-diphosphate synthase [Ignavibacteriae bacterium]|nr:(E)-4-hydroxy-3-methylbut-2-enyl-diphosphate synthase [Ignavibacteriota bacterium]
MMRFKTRIVNIGSIPLGGDNPIRIQSMTTTDTMDTDSTVKQCKRIIEAGADYVRITAPSINEAKNLESIKKKLRAAGFKTPLIADIHFTPNAAEVAARLIEKVRINPGNYVDKKKFNKIEYSNSQYEQEIEKIRDRFLPLVKICKEYGTAMRIGTNHGSLSDRIMSRYGDTPLGMVESALEFVRICEDVNYRDIVLSMKSSNPQVIIDAYRLLVKKMTEEGMNYPLHLGVTEAGDGEDGRIKSSLGIGTLLEEGIGDTIRVSLTEEPEFEIPVCKILVEKAEVKNEGFFTGKEFSVSNHIIESHTSITVDKAGGKNVPPVIIALEKINYETLKQVGYFYSESLDKWNISEIAPDYIYAGMQKIDIKLPGTLKIIYNHPAWLELDDKTNSIPIFCQEEYNALNVDYEKFVIVSDISDEKLLGKLKNDTKSIIILGFGKNETMNDVKDKCRKLIENGINLPVIISKSYDAITEEKFTNYAAVDAGGIIINGFGNGIWLDSRTIDKKTIVNVSFGILQAARKRISKTEYISCPSCGRTLFDLQETTAKIRERTNHLKGVKIAIMGCIVNGPGEMADADYGYVGSGAGKISLYKGKEVVKRGINSENAVDELINLIKDNGDWTEESSYSL